MFMLHPYNKENCNSVTPFFIQLCPFLKARRADMTRPKCLHMKMRQLLKVLGSPKTAYIHLTKLGQAESFTVEVTFIIFLRVFNDFSLALLMSFIYNE